MADTELKNKYDAIAFQINREDELLSKRLTWSLTINGFLFAAVGLISRTNAPNPDIITLLTSAVPWVGFAVSAAALIGVTAANMQIWYLKCEWQKLEGTPWVRPFGGKFAFLLGWVPSLVPPAVLVAVWVIVLYRIYC